MNRQILFDGTNSLNQYTDFNLIAGSGITITPVANNSLKRVDVTLVSSGGSTYQAPLTGELTGTNTWTTAPSVIVVDGVPKQKTQTDGTVNWTGTTTTVLAVLPNFDIYAI